MSAALPPSLAKIFSTVTRFIWPPAPQPVVQPPAEANEPPDPIAPSGVPESVLKQLGPHRGRNLYIRA